LQLRTFLVGRHVTAADLIVVMPILKKLSVTPDHEKLQNANVFRWADHIQNLPGIKAEVEKADIFVSFPDSNAKPPTKSELKRLAKMKALQEKKQNKKDGKEEKKEEKKEVKAEANTEAKTEVKETKKEAPGEAKEEKK